jgi:hypothetical protein
MLGMQEATQDALELQLDGEAERFFSQPPGAWEVVHDDWQPEPLSSLERVAMLTTAAPGMALLTVALTLLCTQAWLAAEPQERAAPVHAVADVPPPPVSEAVVHERPLAVREPAPAQAPPAPVVSAPVAPVVTAPVASLTPRRSGRSTKRAPSAVTRARQLLDAGRAADARDLARSAIRSAPGKAAGYIVLAAALDKLGDRAGMKATFHSCVEQAEDPLASACRSLAR